MDAVAAALPGRRSRRLRVSHAFHSPLMEPMLAEFAAVAAGLSYAEPPLPVVSNVTGALAEPGQLTDPGYWVRHVREPVRFADGLAALRAAGATWFAEAGPGRALTALAPPRPRRRRAAVGGGARGDGPGRLGRRGGGRGADEERSLAGGLARLFTAGAAVDWAAWFAGTGARRVALPTYPFQRERLLAPAGAGSGGRGRGRADRRPPPAARRGGGAGRDRRVPADRPAVGGGPAVAGRPRGARHGAGPGHGAAGAGGPGRGRGRLRAGGRADPGRPAGAARRRQRRGPGHRGRPRTRPGTGRSASSPAPTPSRAAPGPSTPADVLRRADPAPASRSRRTRRRGRRPGRPRSTWTGSTSGWPRTASATGRRSGGCGRPGSAAARCSPRWSCRRRRQADAGRFGLHPALLDALRAAPVPCWRGRRRGAGCRSPGPGCRCTRAGPSRLRARITRPRRRIAVRDRGRRRPGRRCCRWSRCRCARRRPAAAAQAGPAPGLLQLDWVPAPAGWPAASVRDPACWCWTAAAVPPTWLAVHRAADGGGVPGAGGASAELGGRGVAAAVLGLVQEWLAEERLAGSRLVVLTPGCGQRRGPGRGGGVGSGPVGAVGAPGPARAGRRGRRTAPLPVAAMLAGGRGPVLLVRGGQLLAPAAWLPRRPGRGRAAGSWARTGRSWSPAGPGASARSWPGTWPAGTASGTCCWSPAAARLRPGPAELAADLAGAGRDGDGRGLRRGRPRAAGRCWPVPGTADARWCTRPGCSTTG